MEEKLASQNLSTLGTFRIDYYIVRTKIDCYLFWIHGVMFSLLCLYHSKHRMFLIAV